MQNFIGLSRLVSPLSQQSGGLSIRNEETQDMARAARIASILLLLMSVTAICANAQQKKPNILVIFGDDIGYSNISAYNLGMMGYKTPNIDRVA
jgi:glycosylphosphatidylinositol transamidase (GPIT) subunit GPI8